MQAKQRLKFESTEGEQLYSYIERNGVVDRGELESEFSLDPERVDEALASLVDAGHIEKRDETYRIKIDYDARMTFETDGIEVTIRTP
ncbi:MAG: FeoC-like transcriptional regulator, partial [Halovenus sp.]